MSPVSVIRRIYPYVIAVPLVVAVTLPLWLLRASLTWANIALIYVLVILVIAVWRGTGPSLLAAVGSFFASEYFLLKPLYVFAVSDPREFLDLCVYLVVAIIAGQLGAYARRQTDTAGRHADQQRLLYSLSSAFNQCVDREGVATILRQVITDRFCANEVSILPGTGAVSTSASREMVSYLLLSVGDSIYGTVRVVFSTAPSAEQSHLLTACVMQAAMALQRLELTYQAQRSLSFQEADRLKTAILHAVSHDLRTPITIIKTSASNLQALRHRLSEEEQREMVEAVEREADHLDKMVGNLLDLSRLKAGALIINKDWNAIGDVAGDVAARAWQLYHRERIKIVFPPDMPLARFDYGLMRQVLNNVVENALRYEPDSSLIELQGSYLPDEVRLSVINHGPSIPAEEKEQIMQPFTRQENGHAGLGLAISKGIVEAHDGRIWVEDTPGGGATFVISLPRDVLEEVPYENTGC